MLLAITHENNQVFQHFGRCPSFVICNINENKEVIDKRIVQCDGVGHGALVQFLKELNVDEVICGGLGLPMYNKLTQENIKVYGGVQGTIDEVLEDYLNDTLDYDPNAAQNHGGCHHHDHQLLS